MEKIQFNENDVFLVTGGAGFIGSNLCEAILKLGCKVRCLDDLSTGKYENVKIYESNPNYTFIKGNITDIDVCTNACEGVTYVLHQAGWGSVPKSIKMPAQYERVNVQGTVNMLEAAKVNGVKKFVYASSSSVYGDSEVLPKREGEEGEILSPYALTKKMDEEYGRLYKKLYGLNTYGLRYFNVYGPRQNMDSMYAAVIPIFIKKIMNNEQATIYGDGRQSRDFTYVANVVQANLKACKASDDKAGEVYNIACGEQIYLYEVYDVVSNLLKQNIAPIFSEARVGDIRDSNADISKAMKDLGYNPKYMFEEGIKLTVKWYEQNEK
ncbi:SDR family oxidoreductase [Eubacterium sp.]